jgi:CDP-diacylglycerol--glycerol-3-phosphate 3-phosphatidyltransferase/cardiolipin synthase
MADRRWLILIPNVLTVVRLGLTVAFIFVDPAWWAWIVIAAALSDFADGFLARRYKLTSWIGGLLDAVADKAFTVTVLVTYILTERLQWWQALLLVTRDIVVAFSAIYAAAQREWPSFKRMGSRRLGKITTAMIFLLALAIAVWPGQRLLIMILFIAAAASSIAAGVDYYLQFVHEYRAWRARKSSGQQINKST